MVDHGTRSIGAGVETEAETVSGGIETPVM
jgi:hypothetical protein